MMKRGLKRLNDITSEYHYHSTNLLSCLTLDVEHFHSSQHIKSDSLSMQQYCVQFDTTLKEHIKPISKWSAHYFTRDSSWHPLPDTAIPLDCHPIMARPPTIHLNQIDEELMRHWAKMYGRAVRQRTNRQQTTMAKAGTLPPYLYEVTSTTSVGNVRSFF